MEGDSGWIRCANRWLIVADEPSFDACRELVALHADVAEVEYESASANPSRAESPRHSSACPRRIPLSDVLVRETSSAKCANVVIASAL